jgi:uncharacterized protein YlxP (DUF503 family)
MTAGYVGVLDFELHFPDGRSLKAKRKHLLAVRSRLERLIGASVAEVDHHDLWQRSRMSLAIVRRRAGEVEEALEEARRYLSSQDFELVRADARLLSVEEVIE